MAGAQYFNTKDDMSVAVMAMLVHFPNIGSSHTYTSINVPVLSRLPASLAAGCLAPFHPSQTIMEASLSCLIPHLPLSLHASLRLTALHGCDGGTRYTVFVRCINQFNHWYGRNVWYVITHCYGKSLVSGGFN